MVPGAGLEPAQYFYRGILSPLRLPISPLRQERERIRLKLWHNFFLLLTTHFKCTTALKKQFTRLALRMFYLL